MAGQTGILREVVWLATKRSLNVVDWSLACLARMGENYAFVEDREPAAKRGNAQSSVLARLGTLVGTRAVGFVLAGSFRDMGSLAVPMIAWGIGVIGGIGARCSP
jgi:hypothetical protein